MALISSGCQYSALRHPKQGSQKKIWPIMRHNCDKLGLLRHLQAEPSTIRESCQDLSVLQEVYETTIHYLQKCTASYLEQFTWQSVIFCGHFSYGIRSLDVIKTYFTGTVTPYPLQNTMTECIKNYPSSVMFLCHTTAPFITLFFTSIYISLISDISSKFWKQN